MKVGDEVKCIDIETSEDYEGPPLILNDIYTVSNIHDDGYISIEGIPLWDFDEDSFEPIINIDWFALNRSVI